MKRILGALALALLLSSPAPAADRTATAVQDVPCEPGPDLRLAGDGTLLACRLAAAADLLVAPAAGNGGGGVACSAGGRVEFHRNGYLSFCDRTGGTASYQTRGRGLTRCRGGARVAFDEDGRLEYCS
jgi:hypothetical protein